MKSYRSSKDIFNRILSYEKNDPHGLNGTFILIHLGTDDKRTDKFYTYLPKLIKVLEKKGYQFVSVKEALGLNIK
jgi:endoglucanase